MDEAVRVLEDAGVRVPRIGRLRAAAKLLEGVATAGHFPNTELKLRRIANAMADASDFYDITRLLPPDRSRQILGELQQTMKGTLDDQRRDRPAYRFQSQYWLGSVLTRGGYRPRTPVADGGSPDYLVDEGTYQYGVEIKRPKSGSTAVSLIAHGASQLQEYGVDGLIVADLSECVGMEELSYVAPGSEVAARDAVLQRFRDTALGLRRAVLDDVAHRLRSGFENVLGLLLIARGCSWLAREPSGLALFATAGATMFFSPVKNLRYHHSIRLFESTVKGLRNAGYEFEEFREVASPAYPLPFYWRL